MTVTRDRRYEYPAVLVRMQQSGVRLLFPAFVMAVVAALLCLRLVGPLQTASEMTHGFLFVALGAVVGALLSSFITRQSKEIRGLSDEVDFQWKQAVARDDGNELFSLFPPTQEEVDAELTRRGRGMGRACRALAEFYQRHPEVLAARAKGNPVHIPIDILEEEKQLKAVLDEAKASFWDLHSMLWRRACPAGIVLRDTWQAYDDAASSSAGDGDIV